jgi:signal transduction histidine kinase
VLLVALIVLGIGMAVVLYGDLWEDVDDAAERRVDAIVEALGGTSAEALSPALFATDERIVAVQVLRPDGTMLRHGPQSWDEPLLFDEAVGDVTGGGLRGVASPVHDVHVSGQMLDTPSGTYVVLVGEGTDGVESIIRAVAVTLAVTAPIVMAVSAAATYWMVRRSMRSVDEIRSRVADITTTELGERVPVPDTDDEIAKLAVTMNEMLARVEAGHNAHRRFVGDASHELRSPLTTIVSALDVAAAHPELLDSDLALNTLRPEARRMQALVEDLLLLARADEGDLGTRHVPIDLALLVDSEVARLRRDTALTVQADVAPARIVADRQGISRAVRNLLDNAERHARTRIEIVVAPRDRGVTITVGDDGPGIPAPDRTRVFDRFVRLDPDRSRNAGGTGLGLSIVAEIVAAHHGSVQISDRPGGGTLVSVYLPAS